MSRHDLICRDILALSQQRTDLAFNGLHKICRDIISLCRDIRLKREQTLG